MNRSEIEVVEKLFVNNSLIKDFNIVEEATEKTFSVIMDLLFNIKSISVESYSNELSKIIQKAILKSRIDEDDEKRKIFYLGIWKAFSEFEKRIFSLLEEDTKIKEALGKHIHLNKFIKLLYENGFITHGELALKMNMENNALSNFVTRIKYLECYYEQKVGIKKFYSINTIGLKYYNTIKKSNNSTSDKHIVYNEVRFSKKYSSEYLGTKNIVSPYPLRYYDEKDVYTHNRYNNKLIEWSVQR